MVRGAVGGANRKKPMRLTVRATRVGEIGGIGGMTDQQFRDINWWLKINAMCLAMIIGVLFAMVAFTHG
jgi:hypothetical protein